MTPVNDGGRRFGTITLLLAAALASGAVHAADRDAADGTRVRAGLAALYDFRSPGTLVRDRAGVGTPLDLKVPDRGAVRAAGGMLELRKSTLVASGPPARDFVEAVRLSGGLTLEAWVTPQNTKQDGPARVVSLSRNTTRRNLTLGQDGNRFEVRLRTADTGDNGVPGLRTPAGSVKTRLTHVVFTHDRTGRSRIYLDGEPAAQRRTEGSLANWDDAHRLALGNEITGDRPWRGTFHLVALYARGLTPGEVARNFRAGPAGTTEPAPAPAAVNADHFRDRIAPLLTTHCLECHDADTGEGGLVLTTAARARAGGDGGPGFVPGDAGDSPLWQYVEADEMPLDRPPLSDAEKALLRDWLDAGADWPEDVLLPVDDRPRQHWVRRLTVPEYVATVRATTGADLSEDARRLLPKDLRADGFSNTAYNLGVDLAHVDAYARLAEITVERMDLPAFARDRGGCPQLTAKCLPTFVERAGAWLLRGPLDEEETASFLTIAESVDRSGGDAKDAAGFIVEAMLQSPRFLYRIERQRGDGTAWPAGGYELASRLSYTLWGGPPDEELYRAAAAGELSDRERVRRQVARMLEDPRAGDRAVRFAEEWLDLDRLADLRPSPDRFPDWSPELAADMREETRAFVRHVVWEEGRPLTDLFDAQVTFVTPRLAAHYGDLGPGDAGDGKAARVDLANVPSRGGLLTQGSVLTVGGDDGSMVTRGLFVLEDVLRGSIGGPPPGVDTTPVPPAPGLSQRGVALTRLADSNCGGCHSRFEPLAFGLERFDGLGRFRALDGHGNALREDGELRVPAGGTLPYATAAELMGLLAASDRVAEALTWKVAQFALGRPPTNADRPELEKIHRAARAGGFTYRRLITEILLSDLVLKTPTESPAP